MARGYRMLLLVFDFYARGDLTSLRSSAPLFEEVYAILRARKQDDYSLSGVLSLLALAGYFVSRRYAVRYGDEAIASCRRVLRLDLAERLTRFLGGKLALLVAFALAGVSLALRRRRAATLLQTARQAMGSAAALAGTAASCIDPDNVERYAAALKPFTALGSDHAASATYEFASMLIPHVRDRPAQATRLMRAFLTKMEGTIRDLPDSVKSNYVAGCLFTLGLLEARRDESETLQIADRLERYSPLNAMNADQLRATYYAGRGDLERTNHYKKRMEVHAVQLGSAWQVETWAPADAVKIAARTHDATTMKRALQELARLSAEIPAMQGQEQDARGTYLVLRRKYAQAIALLDNAPVQRVIGWSTTRGCLAQAHNALGNHAKARELCLDVLATVESADLDYVAANLNVQIELALAEANLGQLQVAKLQLDKLLARHAQGNNPLTLGALHQARARVALLERDFAAARGHLDSMETYYRTTGVQTLIEQLAPLRRQLERTESPRSGNADSDALLDRAHVMTRVQLMLDHDDSKQLAERAQKGLQVALELSSADEGFLVLADHEGEPLAHLGNQVPSRELVEWAEQNMLDAAVDEQTVMTAEVDSEIDSNSKVVGQTRYCVVPLWAKQDHEDRVVAALVLGFDNRVPRLPEPAVIRAIAVHLAPQAGHAS
jgi:tetratricopeptide (TPR) repeat protein